MDYLFGTMKINNAIRRILRTKAAPGEDTTEYEPGKYYVHSESYPDVTLTDNFKVDSKHLEKTDSEGNKYVWYILSEYSRNIDRSPSVQIGVNENKSGINRNSANIDYVAMMADINIPTDEAMQVSDGDEVSASERMASYAPSGIDGPEMMDAAAHSPKFERVKGYYDAKLWNAEMVHNAVGRWITSAEETEIIGAVE